MPPTPTPTPTPSNDEQLDRGALRSHLIAPSEQACVLVRATAGAA